MTEKNYAPQPKESKKMIVKKTKERIEKAPIKKENKNNELKKGQETKKELTDNEKIIDSASKANEQIKKKDEKKIEKKKEIMKKSEKKVPKKTEAMVNAINLPISTKYSVAVCRFIKRKKIEDAIADLEQVIIHKKAIPMKGEIPHRKGKIMSGRYPKKAVEHFIKLLKSLLANANSNRLDNPIIAYAKANLASRPFGRFGRVRKKRTHVTIKAKEKKLISKNKKRKKT